MASVPQKPVGVSSYDWETGTYTYNAPAMDAAQMWRTAVALAATKARQALPACTTRIDKAIELVLNNAVELLSTGQARVTSQHHGTTAYIVCNGTCECADFATAPEGWCKQKEGRWTGGVIPVGYDLDTVGLLIPSQRLVAELGMTAAEMVQDLFQWIANGSSSLAECHRLNSLGVTTAKRYANGVVVAIGAKWRLSRVNKMLHNRVYIGQHTVKSARGAIERDVPALVTLDIFEAVQAQLRRNSCLPKNPVHRLYLLRSLITCRLCRSRYVGTPIRRGQGKMDYYYRCGGQTASQRPAPEDRCQAKIIKAEPLEDAVWAYCRNLVLHPEQALERVQQRIVARQIMLSAVEDARQEPQRMIAELEAKRQRVMTLYTRGHKSLDEVEADLAQIAAAKSREQEKLDAFKTQRDVSTILEAHYQHVTSILEDLQEEVREIDQTNDLTAKRRIVEIIIRRIPVETTRTGRRKHANVYIDDLFDQTSVVETLTG